MRSDGRRHDQIRNIQITRNFLKTAEGSVLIAIGNTKVICTATLEDKVPPFLKDRKRGWVTAEYGMLPRSTPARITRESVTGRVGGRTHEIQRLIGRALRSVTDMEALGEKTVWIDCDVIQADGGTRTASITGAFICMADALTHAIKNGVIERMPLTEHLAAVSVGMVQGEPMLDLCYEEDSTADVDMNIVMTGSGRLVEIQGTAEATPFTKGDLDSLISLAEQGIKQLITKQKEYISFETTYRF